LPAFITRWLPVTVRGPPGGLRLGAARPACKLSARTAVQATSVGSSAGGRLQLRLQLRSAYRAHLPAFNALRAGCQRARRDGNRPPVPVAEKSHTQLQIDVVSARHAARPTVRLNLVIALPH
jgi:hypothetical protein